MSEAVTELPEFTRPTEAFDGSVFPLPEAFDFASYLNGVVIRDLREPPPLGPLVLKLSQWDVHVMFWGGDHTKPETPVTVLQYGEYPNIALALDFGELVNEFPRDQQEAVGYLRANGRPILADKLVTMLQNVQDDPDEPEINIFSLQDMARLFVERKDFADPFIGPARGIVHAQWRIDGNGALVWVFLGNEEILVVAQADEVPGRDALDISTTGAKRTILKEFEHLVPRCK
jgi:hypothetical protein